MHIPVLLQETVEALAPFEKGVYVDCTVNRGGHSRVLLSSLPITKVVSLFGRFKTAKQLT